MVKMTPSEGQILTKNFILEVIWTFRAENKPKNAPFKAKKQCPNNFWTTPKQLSKSPKNEFFGPENGQITATQFGKSGRNFDFGGHQN